MCALNIISYCSIMCNQKSLCTNGCWCFYFNVNDALMESYVPKYHYPPNENPGDIITYTHFPLLHGGHDLASSASPPANTIDLVQSFHQHEVTSLL